MALDAELTERLRHEHRDAVCNARSNTFNGRNKGKKPLKDGFGERPTHTLQSPAAFWMQLLRQALSSKCQRCC